MYRFPDYNVTSIPIPVHNNVGSDSLILSKSRSSTYTCTLYSTRHESKLCKQNNNHTCILTYITCYISHAIWKKDAIKKTKIMELNITRKLAYNYHTSVIHLKIIIEYNTYIVYSLL